MAYQKKYKCYQCGGSGQGMTDEWISFFEKDTSSNLLEWKKKLPCRRCDGKGYNEYDFKPERYKGKFDSIDWEKLDVVYEDFSAKYKCVCGGEIFFGEADMVVCNCGRVYKLSIHFSVDETHLNDMEYWEKYEDKV